MPGSRETGQKKYIWQPEELGIGGVVVLSESPAKGGSSEPPPPPPPPMVLANIWTQGVQIEVSQTFACPKCGTKYILLIK